MRLVELNQPNNNPEADYYDPSDDTLNTRELGDTRKPLITLRDVNKLKKIRALHQLNAFKKQDQLEIQYGTPEDQSGGMGF
jgi:predicted RNA-binding protein with PUA-like domain